MIKKELVNILDDILAKNKFSNVAINEHFDNKKYKLNEKAFIKNLLTITIKNLIYIDYLIDSCTKNINKRSIKQILRISLAQMYFTNSDIKGAIYEAVELAKEINEAQGKFVNAVLRNIVKKKENLDKKLIESNKLDILLSYPKWLYDKILIDFKENGEEILKSLKERSYLSVRINTKKISKEDFLDKISKIDTKILYNCYDVYYLSNYKIFEENIFKNNEIIIQDASSYLAAMNMTVKDGDTVLDACSSPGGKSLAILDLFNPKELISCDIDPDKIEDLKALKKKLNLDKMNIMLQDASKYNEDFFEKFDSILLDVPCSSLGVLRRKPEKAYNITASDIKYLKKLQKKIFENNIKYLKKGGYLIYSTCTLTRNENTNNIKYFLENNKNLKVVDLKLDEKISYIKDENNGVFINPENGFLDGFYIIKFKKE